MRNKCVHAGFAKTVARSWYLVSTSTHQQHLELHLLGRFTGIRRRAREPAFNLLKRYGVCRRGLTHFDVENSRQADALRPRIIVKPANTENRRFVERFGFDFRGVTNAARVLEAHNADANGHVRGSIFAFYSLLRLTALRLRLERGRKVAKPGAFHRDVTSEINQSGPLSRSAVPGMPHAETYRHGHTWTLRISGER